MPSSAACTFYASQSGNIYDYQVVLSNTSDEAFDIYAFIFGGEYLVPVLDPYPFKDVVVTATPAPRVRNSPFGATYRMVSNAG